jgi:predicted nucleotidyltransferase
VKAAGVARPRVFGSAARGEHGSESDIDIVVAFDEENGGVSLLDLVHLDNRLSDLLGAQVDLVQEKSLKGAGTAQRGTRGAAAAGHSRQY